MQLALPVTNVLHMLKINASEILKAVKKYKQT